jgi:hypothetical protein
MKTVQTHDILIVRKPVKRGCVLTEEKLDDISYQVENSPGKFLWQLAQESGVSVGSAWKATKLLHIHLYKITIVPEIKRVDYEKRLRFWDLFIARA